MIIIPIHIGTANFSAPRKYSSRLKAKKTLTMSLAISLNTSCSFLLSFLFLESIGLYTKICRAFITAAQSRTSYEPNELINPINANDVDKSSVEEIKQTTEEFK